MNRLATATRRTSAPNPAASFPNRFIVLHSSPLTFTLIVATLVSLITLLLVSMGMFTEPQDALNLIWRIPGKSGSLASSQNATVIVYASRRWLMAQTNPGLVFRFWVPGQPPSQFCIAALPRLCHTAIKRLPRSITFSTASAVSSAMSSAKLLRCCRVRAPECGAIRIPVPTPAQNPAARAVALTMRERVLPFIVVSPFILLQIEQDRRSVCPYANESRPGARDLL